MMLGVSGWVWVIAAWVVLSPPAALLIGWVLRHVGRQYPQPASKNGDA